MATSKGTTALGRGSFAPSEDVWRGLETLPVATACRVRSGGCHWHSVDSNKRCFCTPHNAQNRLPTTLRPFGDKRFFTGCPPHCSAFTSTPHTPLLVRTKHVSANDPWEATLPPAGNHAGETAVRTEKGGWVVSSLWVMVTAVKYGFSQPA